VLELLLALLLHAIELHGARLDEFPLQSRQIGLSLRFLDLPSGEQSFRRPAALSPSLCCLGQGDPLPPLDAFLVDPAHETRPVANQRLMFDLDDRVFAVTSRRHAHVVVPR
jgi:hypothetical protein